MKRLLKNSVLLYSDFDSETRIIVTIPQHILRKQDIALLDHEILAAIQTVLPTCECDVPLLSYAFLKHKHKPAKLPKTLTRREANILASIPPDGIDDYEVEHRASRHK